MNRLFGIIFITFLASCKNNPETLGIQLPTEDFTTRTIKLADSLGTVNINRPSRYDTSFTWTHYSDCGKRCEKIKYRFQPSILKIVEESGWIWDNEPKDSTERLTISHSGYFPFGDKSDSLLIHSFHRVRKESIAQQPFSYPIKSDTIEKIGNRFFSIILIDTYDSTFMLYAKKLQAMANIKNNEVYFDFELFTKQTSPTADNFINNAYAYLRSVRIDSAK